MKNDLHRLVYYSRSRVIAAPDAFAETITAILTASQANNAKVDVTGMLMFNSGCFAQVLEGPRAAVEGVFERIQQDERHGDVSLLAFDPAPARAFERWAMGFVGHSATEAARYGAILPRNGFNPAGMAGVALFETLHRLALEEETAAPEF